MRTADVLLEAVVFGQVALTAHMPLAYVPRLVAAFAIERRLQQVLGGGQILEIGHVDDAAARGVNVALCVYPVGNTNRGRIFARQDIARVGEHTGQAA